MKPLRTERLILRNWEERDRELFHLINSDDQVMEFFPMRRSRAESDGLMDRLADNAETNGFGFTAVEIIQTGEVAGFCGLVPTSGIPVFEDGTIEIGWRLAPQFWGKGIVTEAARCWRYFAFEHLGLERIVSFAVTDNHRSISVMQRIGMSARPDLDFDHPGVPDTHPHLKRHALYEIFSGDARR
ncbi:Acetyltransferase, including N-acetylase of ribosomal protein [Hoeflea phototrophica DFL-43]|jgi:RimJ/RimL family protein N-acetyltransferase|uniref:Acetyltransferase, including N-acetylase of ribosomal protein n=1 Tax=Hoeflea phototrophica (strain DSM 17068 / NCIMB 14078 / DFL-43) TaxID=411684 RepID=A9D3K5_HOEPD|nr:GNAT family N-acetyltransferase [Hoeflea phototrophica]EDQ33687.1 Acetyltransferase, including N-acetylase of ribosomal protein [Hoeflea phototrophica DFL-43]